MNIDPSKSLNGAQVTAMLSIVEKVKLGELSEGEAINIMATSFPIDATTARNILSGK